MDNIPRFGDSDNDLLFKIAGAVAGPAAPITGAEVITALGYTPLANTAPAVINALGFTPLASPLLSIQVTNALGYTPQKADSVAVLAYSATTNIDFTGASHRTLALTGDVTFTTSNRAAAREAVIIILADGTPRSLAFPVGWIFVGAAAPTTIAAGKTAILSLFLVGTADTDVKAAYAVQA